LREDNHSIYFVGKGNSEKYIILNFVKTFFKNNDPLNDFQ